MPVFMIWHPPKNKEVDSHGQLLTNRAENFLAQFFHELEQF